MRIAVIDGQGGGIGRVIVEKISQTFGNQVEIVALGTNSAATSIMLKAGANEGATGENAIVWNSTRVDMIIGPIGIVYANAMLGEVSPVMACAIADSPARKILIPLTKSNIEIAGLEHKPLPHFVMDTVEMVNSYMRGDKDV